MNVLGLAQCERMGLSCPSRLELRPQGQPPLLYGCFLARSPARTGQGAISRDGAGDHYLDLGSETWWGWARKKTNDHARPTGEEQHEAPVDAEPERTHPDQYGSRRRRVGVPGARAPHPAVQPSPASHAILTVLKAGESVFSDAFIHKTVVHAYRGAQPLFHALFGVKTLSATLFAPPLMKRGYGTRFKDEQSLPPRIRVLIYMVRAER